MVTRNRKTVKQKTLLSKRDIQLLKISLFGKIKGITDKVLYTALAWLNLQLWCACKAWGVVTDENPNEINHDRLRQLALGSFEEVVEFKISTSWFGNVYLKKCWEGITATSNKTWLMVRNLLGDVYFEEIDPDSEGNRKLRMVLGDEPNPETGEFEEKCERGLGIYKIIQPVPQESAKTGRPAGITTLPGRFENFNIAKALVTYKTIYRILESKYNKKHNYNPATSFYDQLPEHKGNFVRNLWNAFSGNEDFEGNIYSEDYRDFVFQYPETLVERVSTAFNHVWKEKVNPTVHDLCKEAWEKMQQWGRAIPSWRKDMLCSEVIIMPEELQLVELQVLP